MKDFNDQHQALGAEAVCASLATPHSPEALARLLLADPTTPETTRRKLREFAAPEDAPVATDIPSQEAAQQETALSKTEPNPSDDKAAYIKRLARLSKLDFALIKKEAAKEIGITAGELAEIVKDTRVQIAGANQETQGRKIEPYEADPWPVPVEGAEVLSNAYHAIKQHMAIKDDDAIITALWTVHTHVFDIFRHTPRLTITAPNAECGKSVLSHLIEGLVTRPLSCEGLTPAPFFRVIEIHHPTLLIDECDTFFKQDSGLISGINGGFEPGGGQMRCEGEEHIPMIYSTHTPIVLIGIKLHKILPPSTLSRSFVITLERAIDGEIAELYDRDIHQQGLLTTGRKIARWCADNRETLRNLKPTLPPNARNRRADKWRPLFAIAEMVGEEWPKRVLKAYLSEEKDDTTKLDTALQLLADIREVLKPSENVISTADLIERLCALDESPWPEYNFRERDEERRRLQDRQIAKLLKDYRVKPDSVRPQGATSTVKGYRRTELEIAWKRYLPATLSTVAGTPEQNIKQPVTNETKRTSKLDAPLSEGDQTKQLRECSVVPSSHSAVLTDDDNMVF